MDKLEKQLKQDAEAIHAEPSPAFAARLGASLEAVAEDRARGGRNRSGRPGGNRWWLASLTGAAVAALLIALVNRPGGEAEMPSTDSLPVATTLRPVTTTTLTVPLDVQTAEFTEPLAEELENLKTDLDKARESLEEDLRFTF